MEDGNVPTVRKNNQEDNFVFIEPFSWVPFITGFLILGMIILISQSNAGNIIYNALVSIGEYFSHWFDKSLYLETFDKLNVSVHLLLILKLGTLLFLGAMTGKIIVWPVNFFSSYASYRIHNRLRLWLDQQNEKLQNRKFADQDKDSKTKKYLDWIDIRTFLEVEHFTSLVSQIGRLGISDSLRIEKFENTYISARRLAEIRRLLFKIDDAVLLSGARYDEANKSDKVNDDISELRKTRSRFGITQTVMELIGIFRLLVSLLTPVLFAYAIFVACSFLAPEIFGSYDAGLGHLFLLMAGLIAVVPVSLMAGKVISLFGIWLVLKRSNRQDLLALNILIITVVSFLIFSLFFLLFSFLSYLIHKEAADVLIFTAILGAANDILLPFNTSSGILSSLPATALITARIIAVIGTSVLLYILFRYAADLYESTFYDRSSKGVSIPPELIRIGGAFLIFLYSTAILYTVVINIKNIANPPVSENVQKTKVPQNVIVQVSPPKAENPEPANFSGYLPYSVFLALIGGLLALSTRELLENYFHGLSLRVDAPFEEGDRVVFNDSGMTAIDKIGVRAVSVYEINTNSKITIPWKDVTKSLIRNYTRPTLDYRREISVNLPTEKREHPRLAEGPLYRAECLLLMVAMFEAGVKRPFIGSFVGDEKLADFMKSIDLFSETNSKHIQYTNTLKEEQLMSIWRSTGIEKFQDRTAFNNVFCSDIPNILQDLENHQPKTRDYLNIHETAAAIEQAKETQSIRSIKLKIAELILCIYHMDMIAKAALNSSASMSEQSELSLAEQYDISDLLRKDAVWLMEEEQIYRCAILATKISELYADLSLLLWSFKTFQERAKSIVTLRKLDALSVSLLTPPRVYSEHKVTEQGAGYWEVKLQVTVELAEQSDEIVQHINLAIEKMWDRFI